MSTWSQSQAALAAPKDLSVAALGATSTPAPDCGLAWRHVVSPNPNLENAELLSVAKAANGDTWAVGYFTQDDIARTLTQDWEGSQWSTVSSPNSGAEVNILGGVTAVSENDVWAVGIRYERVGTGTLQRTLTEHWDGNEWSVVPSPNPVTTTNGLKKVSAVSTNDVWAVGYYIENIGGLGYHRTLLEHWDGVSWSIVPSPNVGTLDNELWDISARAANDVWAVGAYRVPPDSTNQTLILHWDGTTWDVAPSPSPGGSDNVMLGVYALSSTGVWAVGYENTGIDRSLILHWDGTQWTHTPTPNIAPAYVTGVVGFAPNDAWAVGYWGSQNGNQTLLLHWEGTIWTQVPGPNPGSYMNNLYGVSALSSNDIWAVGTFWDGPGSPFRTLTVRYSDPCAKPSPSATPTMTVTPKMPTATLTTTPATTPMASSTPTSCNIQFTDVPSESTFYTFIQCLACRGIVTGYTTGCATGTPCFKPGNPVTRGQLAKIVANAAGLAEPAEGQQFEDVPEGSTFYEFVWRLADREYISGYPCGGPGEPCGNANIPYFRPNAYITRGQLSKIVANAAGFTELAGSQQFEDVPLGHTFYDYIWRLADRAIMSGYLCGGAGEPCVPPGNFPYFRPAANATRGQASKIVANTFFPTCTAHGPSTTVASSIGSLAVPFTPLPIVSGMLGSD